MKQTNRKCPKCGYVIENEQARYCKRCGTELPEPKPAALSSDSGGVPRRMAFIAGVCIVCMVVTAIVLYKGCGNGRTEIDAGSSVVTETLPFDSQEKFEEHEKNPHYYACDLCDETFTTKAGLQEHEDKDHPVCSKCGGQFSSPEEFEHHEKNPHYYACDQCCMAFTDAADLDAHKRGKHSVYKCEECGKEFKTEKARDEHYWKKHCACEICGSDKWFKTKEELESHIKTYHLER